MKGKPENSGKFSLEREFLHILYLCDTVAVELLSFQPDTLLSPVNVCLWLPMHTRIALGACPFYAAAPTLWNSLPANIRDITSLSINYFLRRIRRHTFLV